MKIRFYISKSWNEDASSHKKNQRKKIILQHIVPNEVVLTLLTFFSDFENDSAKYERSAGMNILLNVYDL